MAKRRESKKKRVKHRERDIKKQESGIWKTIDKERVRQRKR